MQLKQSNKLPKKMDHKPINTPSHPSKAKLASPKQFLSKIIKNNCFIVPSNKSLIFFCAQIIITKNLQSQKYKKAKKVDENHENS